MQQVPDGNRGAAPEPVRRSRGKVLTQVVLPLAIFMAAVAGFTFVSQYGGGGRGGPKNETAPPPETLPLEFVQTKTAWDPLDPSYVPEFENQDGKPKYRVGHYHFLFRNKQEVPVELGFTHKSCSCAKATLCMLTTDEAEALTGPLGPRDYPGPLGFGGSLHLMNRGFGGDDAVSYYLQRPVEWTTLTEKYKDEGIMVPPGGVGLIRLAWDGAQRESINLRLNLYLWAQLREQPKTRRPLTLEGLVIFARPVRTFPNRLTLEDWVGDVARSEFYCWSATRPSFDLSVEPNDKCIEAKAERLGADECRALEDLMNKDENRGQGKTQKASKRVASAYRIRVTVYRRKGDHQLEQGHFQRLISLKSPRIRQIDAVRVDGYNPSEVTIEGGAQLGKIELAGSFPDSEARQRTVFLVVNRGVELLPKIDKTPEYLQVKLDRAKPGPGGQIRWQLTVRFPPNPPTAWPRDAAIMLHIRQEDNSEGRVRLPVLANPYQR
jgi:hypothetical protein